MAAQQTAGLQLMTTCVWLVALRPLSAVAVGAAAAASASPAAAAGISSATDAEPHGRVVLPATSIPTMLYIPRPAVRGGAAPPSPNTAVTVFA